MKIVILAGGYSPEREVSLSSGCMIGNSLISSGHQVALVDVYEGIDAEDLNSSFKSVADYNHKISEIEPDLKLIKSMNNNQEELIGKNVIDLCKLADIVFIALHGSMGENGQLQATLDNYNIKYTGSGYIGSLLAMDKDISKRLVRSIGVPSANWILLDTNQESMPKEELGFPCFVKPCSGGSSVGVNKVNNFNELKLAITKSKKFDKLVIIEEYVEGREFSVGILENKALPVIEIVSKSEFYNYEDKYQMGRATEICPAPIEDTLTNKVQEYALKVHEILRLGSYSRIDFIMDKNEEFYFLEANTLPGMTPTSLFPQEALASNIDFDALCQRMINSSLL